MRSRPWLMLASLAIILLVVVIVRTQIGPTSDDAGIARQMFEIRSVRTLAALLVGACLGLAGVLLQGMLRNPLASPDIMGVGAGAGLAVMFAAYLASVWGASAVAAIDPTMPALIGSMGCLGLILLLSRRRRIIDPVAMVLVGVIISIIASAATMFIQHLMPDRGVYAGRWLYGSIDDDASPGRLAAVGVALVFVLVAAVSRSRSLDAAMMSEDEARSVGVSLAVTRGIQFIGAGALTAAAVSLAGPLGFVGLIGPHLARGLVGPSHRRQLPAATMIGAILVVGADAGVRALALPSGRLPLGVVTALLGGPLFLVLLLRSRGAAGA